MHPNRDIASVRFVGTLSVGIGAVLLILTLITTLFALFSGISADTGRVFHGIITFIIALVTSAAMMGCGAQLQAARAYGWADIENIRLIWTSLVLVMVLVCIVSPWFIPPLTYLGALMLLLLFAIRGAIIRLSGR